MVHHPSSLTRTAPVKANIILQNKTLLKIDQLNTRGSRNKNSETISSSLPFIPQSKCITEHLLSEQVIVPSCEKSKPKNLNQLHTKPIKEDDINNQFMIYHQNIRGL
jgi:hypothetical protein